MWVHIESFSSRRVDQRREMLAIFRDGKRSIWLKKVAGSRGDFFVCFILFLLSVYQGDEGGEKVGGWVPEHIGHYKAGGCFGLE